MRNIHKLFNAVVFVFGMLIFAGSIAHAQVAVSLPNASGQVGTSKTIALTVGSLAGQNVSSFQFTLTYDSTVVNITGVNTAGMIADAYKGNLLVNTSVKGKITVAAAGTTPLTGTGALLSFTVSPLKAGSTALTLSPFTFNEGTPAATVTNGTFTIPSSSFIIPDTTAKASIGGAISVPILSDDQASLNVMAYALTIKFDTNFVKITGFSTTGTLSSGWTMQSSTTPGTIKIAGASATKLSGKGTLLNLTGTAVAAGKGAISFTSVVLNEGTPVIGAIDGSVTVIVNVKPVFTKALRDTTINENQPLALTPVATDANGDVLVYSMTGLPSGATINSATGAVAWTPSYTQAGTYTLTVKATDPAGLADSTKAVITVKDVNRVPVLASRLPSQQIDSVTAGTTIYFSVNVMDRDAQAIKYTWKVNGAVAKTGVDSITYSSNQWALASSYTVTCVFTDGIASDSTTWAFKGVKTSTGVEDLKSGLPSDYSLGQNYPNPFNPSTNIKFGLPKAAPVTLEIYNVLGVKVRTLLNGAVMNASFHNVTWNGKDDNGATVTSGMYLYRITADKFVATMKMMLMK